MLKGYTKEEKSWMMYDWANSAHSVIVVTILPIFFDTVAGYTADSVSSMSTWGFATSLAMAIVALSAPFLGVFRGMRKKLFTAFMLIGVVSVAGLSFTPFMDFTASPEAAGRVAAMVLVLYITSTIGFDASCIYYDAFLTDVTTEDRMDSVSTLGYGLGYIGGAATSGGIGTIIGAVVGAFIMGILNNGMSLYGWSTDIQKIVKGAVLLGAVTVDLLSKRKKG